MPETIDYTWAQYDQDINKFTNWVRAVNFKPDFVVGLLRGGMVPAISLSHALKVPCMSLEWSTRDSKKCDYDTSDQIASLTAKGTKILVIDDIVDSGLTISSLKPYITSGNNNIIYASLWYNPSQPCSMHWWANVIDRDVDERWVDMPWEVK